MFSSIYVFRVAKRDLEEFLEVQREAAEMYQEHGALEDATYVALDLTGKYDCDDFDAGLPEAGAEPSVVIVGTDLFESVDAYEKAMRAIDEDERFHRLSEVAGRLLSSDSALALRGEFERVI